MSVEGPFQIKVNPRYQDAPYEMAVLTGEGRMRLLWPPRYANRNDALEMTDPIPCFLKVYPDGTEVESF